MKLFFKLVSYIFPDANSEIKAFINLRMFFSLELQFLTGKLLILFYNIKMIFLWLCKLCSCESNQLCNIFRFAKTLHNIADYLVTAKIANVGGIFNSSKCHRISCFTFLLHLMFHVMQTNILNIWKSVIKPHIFFTSDYLTCGNKIRLFLLTEPCSF